MIAVRIRTAIVQYHTETEITERS